jgi:hypothetical protein
MARLESGGATSIRIDTLSRIQSVPPCDSPKLRACQWGECTTYDKIPAFERRKTNARWLSQEPTAEALNVEPSTVLK